MKEPNTIYVVFNINRDVIGVATDIQKANSFYQERYGEDLNPWNYEELVLNQYYFK